MAHLVSTIMYTCKSVVVLTILLVLSLFVMLYYSINVYRIACRIETLLQK